MGDPFFNVILGDLYSHCMWASFLLNLAPMGRNRFHGCADGDLRRKGESTQPCRGRKVRHALGNRLPNAQETNLRRLLNEKDEVQYGMRARSKSDAEALLARLEEFASWAEAEMARLR
jgi:hypothetical protein